VPHKGTVFLTIIFLLVSGFARSSNVDSQFHYVVNGIVLGGSVDGHTAAHESPRTTRLYDRTGDEITLDEVERIAI
jgi:hypothetical protein